jgi:hypothetical protein
MVRCCPLFFSAPQQIVQLCAEKKINPQSHATISKLLIATTKGNTAL